MKARRTWKFLFIAYVCLLLYFVVLKINGFTERIKIIKQSREAGFWNYNIYPMRTITPYLEDITYTYAYLNILGNIIPFVPLGMFIPIIYKRYSNLKQVLIIFTICIIGIETLQFITMLGFFDVDDILLNMIGCLVGYSFYVAFSKIYVKGKSLGSNGS
ncbi:VanZ family protein [Lysinibacillus sp. NPDC097195]|uniref:VanZ family protein n=1 Tax=Lysinibacillus sp. NPDC097195 TaxID=3364141 RepID=UPI00381E76BC